MDYLLFWIKVAARRFVSLFKTSPVIIIGVMVIAAAFIVARNDIAITLNTQRLVFAVLFFVLVSLLLSLKKGIFSSRVPNNTFFFIIIVNSISQGSCFSELVIYQSGSFIFVVSKSIKS